MNEQEVKGTKNLGISQNLQVALIIVILSYTLVAYHTIKIYMSVPLNFLLQVIKEKMTENQHQKAGKFELAVISH